MEKIIRLMGVFIFMVSFLSIAGSNIGAQSPLKVATVANSGDQRLAYVKLIHQFNKKYPSIQVELIVQSSKGHKADLDVWENRGTIPYDVIYWFAGIRMLRFVQPGLVESITELWSKENMNQFFPDSVKNLVSYQEDQYAVPFTYYQWGFYYLKSTFEKFKLNPPETWDEMLKICSILKANNLSCFIVGTNGSTWTIGAWFDYFNLRINGLDFHLKLLAGKIPFTDERVRQIFITWKEIIEKDYYSPGHNSRHWKQTLPYLYRNKVGMTLFGSMITTSFSKIVIQERFLQKS